MKKSISILAAILALGLFSCSNSSDSGDETPINGAQQPSGGAQLPNSGTQTPSDTPTQEPEKPKLETTTVTLADGRTVEVNYALNGGTFSIFESGEASFFDKDSGYFTNSLYKYGYTFEGWYTSPKFEETGYVLTIGDLMSKRDGMTIYAKWTPWPVSLCLYIDNNEDGEIYGEEFWTTIEGLHDEPLVAPTAPKGYDFIWEPPLPTTYQYDDNWHAYLARKSIKQYQIEYNLDGGTTAAENPSSYNVETPTFALAEPTKAGHTFIGWSGTGLEGNANKKVLIEEGSTENRAYTANWEVSTITLTLNLNGGSGATQISGKYGTKVTKPERPKRSGLIFAGWNPPLPETFPAEDTTHTAQWEKQLTAANAQAILGCDPKTAAEVVIPEGVTSIPIGLFEDNKNLTSVTIPSTVTSIGDCAFQGCSSLASVTIPSTVTSIGWWAFYGCTKIDSVYIDSIEHWCKIATGDHPRGKHLYINGVEATNIVIPNGVTSIGNYAFYNCTSLASVTIPEGVTSIGKSAFEGCTSLESVTIPEGVTSIGNYAFDGCKKLASVTIPSTVTSIGDYAFEYCYSLESVTIPEGVTSIGDYAFKYCYSLESVTIPEGVTSIGKDAFHNCGKLASVTIPSTVTSIAHLAFHNSGLASVTVKATTPPTLASNYCFFNEPPGKFFNGNFYVPAQSVDAYKAADNWKSHASSIYAIEE